MFPALFALAALTSCGRGDGARGGFTMPPTPVEVAEARPQIVRDRFHALGSVESEAIIQMVSELNATVINLPFGEGQPVARGALIAQLDDREFRADAERTQAQRDQAHANVERAEKLFQEHAIPEQQRDDARTALRVAEANAALAAARLDKTRIRAPWPGIVGVRRVSPGAYLKSGDVITDLTQVDQMKVIFAAPERFAAQLKPGTRVELTTTAYPGVAFRGSVMAIDPVVDASTRTIRLVARIGNPGRKLRSGMSAAVEVTLAERSHALVVPDEAVFAEGSQSFVYVVKSDSTVTRVPVQLGTRDSSQVEVVRGLSPGMRVVRAGHQKLYEGARVAPVPSAAEGPAAAGPGA